MDEDLNISPADTEAAEGQNLDPKIETAPAVDLVPEDIMVDVTELNPADIMEDPKELGDAKGFNSGSTIGAFDPLGDVKDGTGPDTPPPDAPKFRDYGDWRKAMQDEHDASWAKYAHRTMKALSIPQTGIKSYIYSVQQGAKQGLDGIQLQAFAASEAVKAMKDWDNIDSPEMKDILFQASMDMGIPSQFTKEVLPVASFGADIALDTSLFPVDPATLATKAVGLTVTRPIAAGIKWSRDRKTKAMTEALMAPGAKQAAIGEAIGKNLSKIPDKDIDTLITRAGDFVEAEGYDFKTITKDFSDAILEIRERVFDASEPAKEILRQSDAKISSTDMMKILEGAMSNSSASYGPAGQQVNNAVKTAIKDIQDQKNMIYNIQFGGMDPNSYRWLKLQNQISKLPEDPTHEVLIPVQYVRDRVKAIRSSIKFDDLLLKGESPQTIFNWKYSKALDDKIKELVPDYAEAMIPIAEDMKALDSLVDRISVLRRSDISPEEAIGGRISTYFKNPDKYLKEIEALRLVDERAGTQLVSRAEIRALREKIDSSPALKAAAAAPKPTKGLVNAGIGFALSKTANTIQYGAGEPVRALYDLTSGKVAETFRKISSLHGQDSALAAAEYLAKREGMLDGAVITSLGDVPVKASLGRRIWDSSKIALTSSVTRNTVGRIIGSPSAYSPEGEIVLDSYEKVLPLEKSINSDSSLSPGEKMQVIKTLRREFLDYGKVVLKYSDPKSEAAKEQDRQEEIKQAVIQNRLLKEQSTRINEALNNIQPISPARSPLDTVIQPEAGSPTFIPMDQLEKDLAGTDKNAAFKLLPIGAKINAEGLTLPAGAEYEVVLDSIRQGKRPYPNMIPPKYLNNGEER